MPGMTGDPPPTHDPGGKVRLRPVGAPESSALFGGPNDCYRYWLTRTWEPTPPGRLVLWVMMNPSTADADVDDPTVAKCCRLSRRWGFGAMTVVNCFAYRATDQAMLAAAADPVGPDNDKRIQGRANHADQIIMAFGTPKERKLRSRGFEVARMLVAAGKGPKMHALRVSAAGAPWHPLYLPEDIVPERWSP